jgi:hypothetical protein
MQFPSPVKNSIILIVKRVILEFSKPDRVNDLYDNTYYFLDDQDDLVEKIIRFGNRRDVLPIARKNIKFSYPHTVSSGGSIVTVGIAIGGDAQLLTDFFEDFIRFSSRMLIGEKDIDAKLEDLWATFEEDFFSDDATVTFTTQLASFYFQGEGMIEDLAKPKVTIRYLHTDNSEGRTLFSNIKKSIESSYRPPDVTEFTKSIPIIAEYKKTVKKTDRIDAYFSEASSYFEKITFLLRTICGGSAHFDFIRPIVLGNLASDHALIQTYASNHLFTNSPESSTLGNGPYSTWFCRSWAGIESRDIMEWSFVNLKIRDSYSRILRNDPNTFFDEEYKLSRCLEKLVDLIQALENILGDYGRDNGEYVSELVNAPDAQKRKEIKKTVEALYKIRDKYLHGQPSGGNSLESTFNSVFDGKIENLEQAIHSLDYYLKQIILLNVMNPDFKEKFREYHTSLGRPILQIVRVPSNPQPFPQLKTIYY